MGSLSINSNPNYAVDIQRAKAAGLLPQSVPENRKAWETAQGLEANFFNTMVSAMFEGVKGEGQMGNAATGQDSWRSMMIQHYGENIAASGGIGLAPAVYREMLRHQELRPHASPQQPGR
jgi:Rod binding domain-containing protein